MIKFFQKIIFLWRKPKVIMVLGKDSGFAADCIFQVLKPYFSVKKVKKFSFPILPIQEVLVFQTSLEDLINPVRSKTPEASAVPLSAGRTSNGVNPVRSSCASGSKGTRDFVASATSNGVVVNNDFLVLFKKFSLPILVVINEIEEGPAKKEKIREIIKILKNLPLFSRLILNFDDEEIRKIKNSSDLITLTFGFGKEADFFASDIHLEKTTNFKLNYEGKTIPIWLSFPTRKEQIYIVLSAIIVGSILGMNLIEISQTLKNFKN